jgi:hypothetical protein
MFKIMTTIAVFILTTMWAWRNLEALFEKANEYTGIENEPKITTTESGTTLKITTTSSNTEAS